MKIVMMDESKISYKKRDKILLRESYRGIKYNWEKVYASDSLLRIGCDRRLSSVNILYLLQALQLWNSKKVGKACHMLFICWLYVTTSVRGYKFMALFFMLSHL